MNGVAQRAGHEHVVRPRQCAHPRADVHGDPADVIAADLALSGVQPGAHLEAERLHRVADRHRAADRPLRAVEHREEAVARQSGVSARLLPPPTVAGSEHSSPPIGFPIGRVVDELVVHDVGLRLHLLAETACSQTVSRALIPYVQAELA